MGINIRDVNSNELRKTIRRNRDNTPYISAFGGDLKINRSACESYQVDVLSRPYFARRDSGMNHVLAKEAAKNNVAIELCFRDILKNHLKYRANVISHFKEILKFHRKYRFPLILTTDSNLSSQRVRKTHLSKLYFVGSYTLAMKTQDSETSDICPTSPFEQCLITATNSESFTPHQ